LSPFEGGGGMKMELNFNYNKRLKNFARQHRRDSTRAEIRLWCELLRNRQMMGFSFLRQRPIGPFIADFFCKDLHLVVETDGYTHILDEVFLKDQEKTAYLKNLGITVLRFTDDEVMQDIENINRTIEAWNNTHPPTPFKGGH